MAIVVITVISILIGYSFVVTLWVTTLYDRLRKQHHWLLEKQRRIGELEIALKLYEKTFTGIRESIKKIYEPRARRAASNK